MKHQVIFTKGFYLGKYEVTQEEYEKIMGDNPSQFKGAKLPIEMVSWNDAVAFCEALNNKERSSQWLEVLSPFGSPMGVCLQSRVQQLRYSWGE